MASDGQGRVGYVYDPLYLEHGWTGHPENPTRLQAIMAHLQEQGFLERLTQIPARDASSIDLELVHTADMVEKVHSQATRGSGRLDPDTYVHSGSYEVAIHAAGGCLAAVDAILDGQVDSAFCLVRPPGHHATPTKAMGFCLFNNLAIAAAHAVKNRGLERVAVIDFDVHHGNGTQDAFYSDPRVLYFSTHQYPFYPGSGAWGETGEGEGLGATVNVPLPRGCTGDQHLQVYKEVCLPIVRRYRPQFIFVSAGFDAHFADPLAQMMMTTRSYYEIATLLRELALELCQGRIVFALEGGYDYTALGWSVQACLDALQGNDFAPDPLGEGPELPPPDIEIVLSAVKRTHELS